MRRLAMYATVRETTFEPEKLARGKGQVDEFWRIRAAQPGYRGALTVDAGDGRAFIVSLWDSSEQSEAAQAILDPESQRLMGPLRSAPPRILGRGEVSYNDLAPASMAAPAR